MRGIGQDLTVGERIAWYRRRRGMSQEVLAGIVGRTVDWLSKVENNRIDLDRLSVIRSVAGALDVSIGDLVGEPTLLDWTADSGTKTVPALREALLNYRQLSPFIPGPVAEPPEVAQLRSEVTNVWDAYQASRYGYVVARLPQALAAGQAATQTHQGEDQEQSFALLALTYQAAAVLLTKLGEADLAWIAAERGFTAAQRCGDAVVIGSLFRSVAHTLLSTGRYREAKQLTTDAAAYMQPGLAEATPEYLSVYGTLFLAGSVAAARDEDRASVRSFLNEADQAARRLGHDANHLWTAFGPTNVAIHRVTTAMDLDDVQVAIDLGPRIDTTGLPVERQARHALETARALSAWNRTDEAMAVVLAAEQKAPEQIRHHAISRQLVQNWMRRGRSRPSYQLAGLAQRVHVTA
ncbi:helix-turn-helix transcriptional regulator [Micromonospora sp. WMMA1363]|uniref:helix-turn-helix domain-containing protein n=1 Tax=Micromonospora sp. WMMA1363 TaxID=3053985 RepID=UPI00259C9848|nr:helix-turn-helix transcriptional regulator [Micromonospora sp. WMMA1363]MDM4720367.1 helix-turn-helix transcriptional regulator [Micromonospora sp. WMMA1363]